MKSMHSILAGITIAGTLSLVGCTSPAERTAAGHRETPIIPSVAPVHPIVASDLGSVNPGEPPPGCPASASPASEAPPPGCPASSAIAGAATTQPSDIGTLSLRAVQCTPGGPAVAADPVAIDFNVRGQLLDHMDTHLSAAGTLDVGGLPVKFGIQPVVRITHGGVVFTTAGEQMDPTHANLKLEVPIFETTEQAPRWSITMRHVIIHPTTEGLDVTEMLSIQSSGDRAWIGKADRTGRRTTLALTLPEGARELKVGGAMDGNSVSFAGGQLVSRQPIIPGEDRYEIQYTVPAHNDSARLRIIAPAAVGHLLVFVPDDGTTVQAAGLQSMGTQQLSEKGPKTRCYIAMSLSAGQTIDVAIGNLASAGAPRTISATDDPEARETASADAPQHPLQTSSASKVIALGGGASILVLGSVVTLLKQPRNSAPEKKS